MTATDEFVPTHPPRSGITERKPVHEDAPSTGFAKDHLQSFVERIIRLEEEKKALAEDIKDIYSEAKSTGFVPAALRKVVRIQRMDQSKKAAYDEVESILETYMAALGML